jgi:TolA-binding protein
MKKKGLVFFAAALGLVFMWQFGPMNAGPTSQATTTQSVEVNTLAERQFASAVTLLKQENFSEAIVAYEKVIRLLPESPIAQDARYWRYPSSKSSSRTTREVRSYLSRS